MKLRLLHLLFTTGMLLTTTTLFGAQPSASILVKNVTLANPGDTSSAQIISLLIKSGELTLVTTDPVDEGSVDQVIDANKGFILGRLDVGNPASFMILDQDPRSNFDALLDTKTHAVFVMKSGTMIRNALLPAAPVILPVAATDAPRQWFSYTAPPMALSTSYHNLKRWNHFKTEPASVALLGALILDRMMWGEQNDASKSQVGDLSSYNGGEIRGLRFGAYGTLNFDDPWIYTFTAATAAFDQGFDHDRDDNIGIYDLRLDIPLENDITLAIGKQKEPISMERLTGLVYLPMQERSGVSDSMMPSRNVGITLSGNWLEQRGSWATGVFNPWLDHGTAIDHSSTQVIGRGTLVPLISQDRSSMIHLGLGLRYTNAKLDLAYQSTPEFNQAPDFVSTGLFDAEDGVLYDIEAAWRWGAFLLNGEYVINQVHSDAAGDPTFTGYHVTASYVLSGEMRPYNRRSGLFNAAPIARPVSQGGWGSWEVAARYSNVDLNDGEIEGGKMDIYSVGLNWWLTHFASFGINYRRIELEDEGVVGHSDGLMTRITLILE